MIRIYRDLESLSLAAAELFVGQARQALAKGRFSVALCGGETPRRTYELLARSPFMDQVPWRAVQFFWGDERWVPRHDPKSNERLARQSLLDHIPVPDDQIHPIYRANITVENATERYEAFLRDYFAGEKQLFDLVFLGLGENGHTASLFPHTPPLKEREHWVRSLYLPEQDMFRVTLTPTAINHSAQLVFLVSGAEKAEILHQVLEGPYQPEEWPAQLIQPEQGEAIWLIDEAAAQRLSDPAKLQAGFVRR